MLFLGARHAMTKLGVDGAVPRQLGLERAAMVVSGGDGKVG